MKSRKSHLYVVTAALVLAGCVAGERRVDTITRSWPATGIHRVAVHEVNGSVDITATDSPEISLVANIRSRGFEPDLTKDNKGYFKSDLDGETLTIGRLKKVRVSFPFFGTGDNITVNYQLRVPRTVELELRTVNGRIATRGGDGETSAVTVNGSIDLETTGKGEISAKSVNGPVKARFLETFQGASLKTVNGSVDAMLPASASFECEASQVNGDFEASFPLSIHSHPGRRRVSGEVNGGQYELRIVTVNGDIHLARDATPPAVPAGPVMPVPPNVAPPPPPVPPPSTE